MKLTKLFCFAVICLLSKYLAQELFTSLLEGPITSSDHYTYSCSLFDKRINTKATYLVRYLFDGVEDPNVPRSQELTSNDKYELDEKYLVGKMKKTMKCEVSSYDATNLNSNVWNATITSQPVTIGITKTYEKSSRDKPTALKANCESCVFESDRDPLAINYRTTIPIRCSDGFYSDCVVSANLTTSDNIVLKQQPGNNNPCIAVFVKQPDNTFLTQLNVTAIKDDFTSKSPRANSIFMRFPNFPNVTVNGFSYPDNWNNYLEQTDIKHYDSPQADCTVSGYSQISTFDGYSYQSGAIGQFKYVNTIEGNPFDVQLRHWQCTLDSLESCVCGVAVQEYEIDVIVDMCSDGQLHFLSHQCIIFPTNAGVRIIANNGNNRFAILFPSGNRIYGSIVGRQMSLDIYLESNKVSLQNGMCGSFNADATDDATMGANVEQWRIPAGQSIFEGFLRPVLAANDPKTTTTSNDVFCKCNNSVATCANNLGIYDSMSQYNYGMTQNIQPKVPAETLGCDSRKDTSYYPKNYYYYNWATATYTSSWSGLGFTEANALAYCQAKLWDNSPLKAVCAALVLTSDLDKVFKKCAREIQISGFLDSYVNIEPELGRLCLSKGAASATAEGIAGLGSLLQMNAAYCESFSCNYNGNCSNQACTCVPASRSVDCSYFNNQIGSVQSMYNGPLCDVRTQHCTELLYYSNNIDAILPRCKFTFVKRYFGSFPNILSSTPSGSNYDENSTICYPPPNYIDVVTLSMDKLTSASNVGTPLLFNVSVLNDAQQTATTSAPLLLYDSYCYNCTTDLNCVQKTMDNRTICLIKGYCIPNGTIRPGDSTRYCNTDANPYDWSFVPTTTTTTAPSTVSGQTTQTVSTTTTPQTTTTVMTTTTTTKPNGAVSETSTTTASALATTKTSTTTSTTTTTTTVDYGLEALTELEQFIGRILPNLTTDAKKTLASDITSLLNNSTYCPGYLTNVANKQAVTPVSTRSYQDNMKYFLETNCNSVLPETTDLIDNLIDSTLKQPGAIRDISALFDKISNLLAPISSVNATNIAYTMLSDPACQNAHVSAKYIDIAYDKSKTLTENIVNLMKTYCSANFNQTTVDAIANLLGISSPTTTSSTTTTLGTLTTPQLIGIVIGSIFGAGLLLLLLSVFGSSILSCLTSFCSCCIGFPCCCCRGFFAASFGACESDCRPICTPVTAECTPCTTPCATPRPVFVPPVKRFVSTTGMASCAPAANYSVNVNNCSGLSTSSQYCGAATSGYRSGSMCARKNCHTYLPQMPVSGNGMMGCSSRVTNIVNKRVDDCGC